MNNHTVTSLYWQTITTEESYPEDNRTVLCKVLYDGEQTPIKLFRQDGRWMKCAITCAIYNCPEWDQPINEDVQVLAWADPAFMNEEDSHSI